MTPPKHRGPHPADARCFTASLAPTLSRAVGELSWLLSRGYALNGALKLVGDRYQLVERQRVAIARSACTDDSLAERSKRKVALHAVQGRALWMDGFNQVTLLESALGGAPIFRGRDGAYRDIAGLHGSYRRVEETVPAAEHLVAIVNQLEPKEVTVLLDRPVSNSGRLAEMLREAAAPSPRPWDVRTHDRVDGALIASGALVATGDCLILERGAGWVDLFTPVMHRADRTPWCLDFTSA